MKTPKQLGELQAELISLSNATARLEAKLDALLGVQMEEDEIEAIELPAERSASSPLSRNPLPYNVRQSMKLSTIEVPKGSDVLELSTPASALPEMKHKDTIPPPQVPTAAGGPPTNPMLSDQGVVDLTAEPYEGYNKETVGDILKRAKNMTKGQRGHVLAYERSHQNRVTLVEALVNWNS